MTPARYTKPCIALIKFRNGTTGCEAFRNEDEFIAMCESESIDWATLCDEEDGRVVVKVSYPEQTMNEDEIVLSLRHHYSRIAACLPNAVAEYIDWFESLPQTTRDQIQSFAEATDNENAPWRK